jgi:hypothetical protein
MQRFVRPAVLAGIALTACLPLPGAWAGTRVIESSPQPQMTTHPRGLASVDLRQPRGYIRKKLLEFTPKGTDFDSVNSFVQFQLLNSGGSPPLTGGRPVRITTFAPEGSGAAARRKRIAAFLGFRHRGLETTTRTAFAAYYAFDAGDRLSDVFVVQDEEFLLP